MFLNTYFAKDIIPGAIHKLLPEETAPEPVQEAPEVLKELKRTNEFMRRSDEETERVINNLESLREELRQMGSTPHKSTSEILDALVQRNERRPH
ncbi:MAG: hypothetical protein IKF82_05005 [Bacilli bacterium]|nr:hypothetical protein [Bacilli bacterium]MBR3209610.1 hypothetical protein [Bacilli bacterium]